VHAEYRAAFDAKNRYGLPEKLPLSWEDFADAAFGGGPASIDRLRERVEMLLVLVDQETASKAVAWMRRGSNASDARGMATLVDRLTAKAELADAAGSDNDDDKTEDQAA
jgi:hypothetical protein